MSDETKKLIEDLKAIRLELFRSAANLDSTITQIDIGIQKAPNTDSLRAIVKGMQTCRNVTSICHDWEHLNELEKETWTKLIDSIK